MNLNELLPAVEPEELYAPVMAEITGIRRLTAHEIFYRLELPGGADLGHQPGQFVEVSIFGVGEAPFSVSSAPTLKGAFELGVRKAGMLTDGLNDQGLYAGLLYMPGFCDYPSPDGADSDPACHDA